MGSTLTSELYLFFVSVLAGICAAVIFDFFRSMRKLGKTRESRVAAEDILLWICEAAFVFAVLYKFNSGGVRLYFFTGLMIGALLYFFTVSKYVVLILASVFLLLKKFFVKGFRILKKIVGIFLLPAAFLREKAGKIWKKIKINSKKLKKQLKMY